MVRGYAGNLDALLAQEPERRLRSAARGLSDLMAMSTDLARSGSSVLSQLMDAAAPLPAWAHRPDNDAHDRGSGYRWYYHCHPGGGRLAGEHGHFHLFSDVPDRPEVTHLVAIAVDPRGQPRGVFAPNRWVTDEHWQPAGKLVRLVERFALSVPRKWQRVHAWLSALLRGFAPQIRQLLLSRDLRVTALKEAGRTNPLEDRRLAVLSLYRIDLVRQAQALDHRLMRIPSSSSRRNFL